MSDYAYERYREQAVRQRQRERAFQAIAEVAFEALALMLIGAVVTMTLFLVLV